MQKTWLIVALLAASCSDCSSEADPWKLDEFEEPHDMGRLSDMQGGSIDTGEGPDEPDTPDTFEPPKPTCVSASQPEFFELLTPDFVHSPTLADERVFAVGARGDEPTSLYEWTPDGMRLVAGGVDAIVGASSEAIWVGDAEEVRQLSLEGDVVAAAPVGVFRYGGLGWFSQIRPNAFGQRIAWVQDGYLRTLDNGTFEEPASDALTSLPWVTADVIAHEFTTEGGRFGVRTYATSDWEFSSDKDTGWPVVTDDHVFFIYGGELWVRKLSETDAQPVIEGFVCGPPFATADGLVVGCNSSIPPDDDRHQGRLDYLTSHFDEVWYVDTTTLDATRIHTSAEAGVFNPVITERWILWYEFDRSSDTIDPFGQGPILALPRGDMSSEPVYVGTIGIGCPTCGAYWPPPRMVLEGDTVAWNYAVDGDEPPETPPRNTYAVAKLSPCDP